MHRRPNGCNSFLWGAELDYRVKRKFIFFNSMVSILQVWTCEIYSCTNQSVNQYIVRELGKGLSQSQVKVDGWSWLQWLVYGLAATLSCPGVFLTIVKFHLFVILVKLLFNYSPKSRWFVRKHKKLMKKFSKLMRSIKTLFILQMCPKGIYLGLKWCSSDQNCSLHPTERPVLNGKDQWFDLPLTGVRRVCSCCWTPRRSAEWLSCGQLLCQAGVCLWGLSTGASV